MVRKTQHNGVYFRITENTFEIRPVVCFTVPVCRKLCPIGIYIDTPRDPCAVATLYRFEMRLGDLTTPHHGDTDFRT
jgi:hypothetical protein